MGEKPGFLLSAYLWRHLLLLRDLVRWPEWYNSKLPVFLVGVFYAVLRLDAPGGAQAVAMAALLVLFCLYAAFGHIVNDYADREVEERAIGQHAVHPFVEAEIGRAHV